MILILTTKVIVGTPLFLTNFGNFKEYVQRFEEDVTCINIALFAPFHISHR